MNSAHRLTVDAVEEIAGPGVLPRWVDALGLAFELHPPPFGERWYGERFRSFATDPSWLAATLALNAQVEGDGSRKLADLTARIDDEQLRSSVWRHAVDESNHAGYYVTMLGLCFPDLDVDPLGQQALAEASPRYRLGAMPEVRRVDPLEVVFDELVQMNIGEVRTRIHHCLFTPVLQTVVAPSNRSRLDRLLQAILVDETSHITYTARILDRAMRVGPWDEAIVALFVERTDDFNHLTVRQVQAGTIE